MNFAISYNLGAFCKGYGGGISALWQVDCELSKLAMCWEVGDGVDGGGGGAMCS